MLAVVLLFSTIYSLPNIYGEDPSIQISHRNKLLAEDDRSSIENVIKKLKGFISTLKDDTKEDKPANQQQVDLEGLNILIVDDDVKNIFVLDGVLSEYNTNTLTAYNGKEAIDILQSEQRVDMILMDIMMPVMDGYEAIEKIRDELHLSTPIIAVTAKTMKEEKQKVMQLGANDFVSKPIDIDALIKIISAWSKKAS